MKQGPEIISVKIVLMSIRIEPARDPVGPVRGALHFTNRNKTPVLTK